MLFKYRFVCLYLPFLLLGLFVVVSVILMPDCSSDSSKARFARSLGNERLSLLYKQVAQLVDQYENSKILRGNVIPKEFSDLDCFQIILEEEYVAISLEYCFDHDLSLVFDGVTQYQIDAGETPAIVLYSNEFDIQKEVLWRQSSTE